MEATECGAACLTMVMAYHGHHAPLSEVREECAVSRDGVDALSVARVARAYGFKADGVKVEPEHLGELLLPAILHWEFRHFVVLERLTRAGAIVVDPASGRRLVTDEQLDRSFTGVALVLIPTERLHRRKRERSGFWRYRELVYEALPSVCQVFAASILLQLVGLLFPVATQLLIDRVFLPRQSSWLWGIAFALTCALILKAVLIGLRSWVVQSLRFSLEWAIMSRFVQHLLRLPTAFFAQRGAGDLLQRAQSNTALQSTLSSSSVGALLDVFLLTGYLVLMLAYDVTLACVVLLFAGLRVGVLMWLRQRRQRIMSMELAAGAKELGALVETVSAIETIRGSVGEHWMVGRWSDRRAERINNSLNRRRLDVGAAQIGVLLQAVAMAAILMIGGRAVLSERISVGVFAVFLTLQTGFMVPVESLLAVASQFQYLATHVQRLEDVMSTAEEFSGQVDPGQLRGAVKLRNVSFRYGRNAPLVLQGINLDIRAGEKVALVGPSGAGKSTLARLLLGMYLPTNGSIWFDGLNLRELDLGRVRRQLGVVLQDTFLFNDTVEANIDLNDSTVSFESVREAARVACIDGTIEKLPRGYATRVGENGARLSGGERQRLCLARALVREPAILLLDEATSAVDPQTEAVLHANLAALGATRILIAHRLATVMDADRVIVLEAGRIVQEGPYTELINRPGLLQRLSVAIERSWT